MNKCENIFCVYLHIRPDTDDVFYVGIGNIRRPYKVSGRNNIWRRIVDKNSGQYTINILRTNVSWDACCKLEVELIKQFGRINNGTGTLCNMTDGGEGSQGVVISVERRAEISKFHKGRPTSEATKIKMRNAQLGKKLTFEHIEKLRKAKLGKVLSEDHRINIGNSQKGVKRSQDFCRRMSIQNKGRIRSSESRQKNALKSIGNKNRIGKNHSAEAKKRMQDAHTGKKLSVIHQKNIIIGRAKNRGFCIEQVDLKSNTNIAYYLNSGLAESKTGISQRSILNCINGKYKSAGGFMWRRSYDLSNLNQLIAEHLAA